MAKNTGQVAEQPTEEVTSLGASLRAELFSNFCCCIN